MPLDKQINRQKKVELTPYNTFGVSVSAKEWLEIGSENELLKALDEVDGPFFILGGGSNILFTRDVDQVVLKNEIKGMEVVERNDRSAVVRVGGGEIWHHFVLWALEQDLGGVENLALIPGTVGAAPIQNIGAYGVELQEVFERLDAVRLADGRTRTFEPVDCAFGYRDSIFKNVLKGQYFITHVYFRLSVGDHHTLRTEYGAIQDTLCQWQIENPSIRDISRAVIHIRQSKLPDPAILGNAGSFFKNPVIRTEDFITLQTRFPDIIHYPAGPGQVKIPAGWLIERCGWKGRRVGRVGCYEEQALVIVNYGGATGSEIWRHARRVMDSVLDTFGIALQPEVNVYGMI